MSQLRTGAASRLDVGGRGGPAPPPADDELLVARAFALSGTGCASERLSMASELVGRSAALREPQLELGARTCRAASFLELDEVEVALAEIDAAFDLALAGRQGSYLWCLEQLRVLAGSRGAHDPIDLDLAPPRDGGWPLAAAFLIQACAASSLPGLAETVYRKLLGLLGRASTRPVLRNPMLGWLGLLAARCSRWREVESLLERGLSLQRNPVLRVLYLHGQASVFLQGGERRMRARGLELLGRTIRDHRRLDLHPELEQAVRLREQVLHPDAVVRPRPLAPRTGPLRHAPDSDRDATFRREGDFWTLGYLGRHVQVKHAKGLADLARLLARPDVEIHVLDLMRGDRCAPTPRSLPALEEGLTTLRDLHAEPDADRRALAAYRLRAEELRGEIEEAQVCDVTRAAGLREELHHVENELASAYGLRRGGCWVWAERARKAVSKRIRTEIRHIAALHPALGAHLRESVRTGVFCAYRARERIDWQLERRFDRRSATRRVAGRRVT